MRLLVFGGWGQLGSELALVTGGRHEILRPPHAEVDVRDAEAVDAAVRASGADAVLDLAAFHHVERCEQDPATAFAVNAVGAGNVARAAAAAGARCVFVSTDYVFDGSREEGYREDDPTGPVNAYGESKETGERIVARWAPQHLIVRASGIFGHAGSSGKGGNFVETMLAKAAAGESVSVVDDQVFAPTAARDLADRLLSLLERAAPAGVYHLTNAGRCSWFEFARAIFKAAGVRADLSPRKSEGRPVLRPAWSVLLDTRSASVGLPPARPWQEALAWYLEHRPEPARSMGGGRS